jgi:glycosyltransferase involved in cell wall biosynthesis
VLSECFAPHIGGIETVTRIVADEFAALGHEVVVATRSPAAAGAPVEEFPFRVERRPSAWRLRALARWSEAVLVNHLSVRMLWPLWGVRRPITVATHTYLHRLGAAPPLAARVKRALLARLRRIAISEAIAAHLALPATVVPNPYRSALFGLRPGSPRDREVAFLGRLVDDKGADLLLAALALLAAAGLRPRLTVIGAGPEEAALRAQAHAAGLAGQVAFAGVLTGEALVAELNRHRVLAVPSRWPEPFGVVALEGLACGCIPVVSSGGGLPDAVGACGLVFASGDAAALAAALRTALGDDAVAARLRAAAPAHLQRHAGPAIAARYLEVMGAR